jgi:hypothetical protein
LVGKPEKKTTGWKSLTNIITWCCIQCASLGAGFELTTEVVMGADSSGTTITTKTVYFSVYGVWRLGRINIIWVNVQSNVQSWNYNKRHKWCGVTMKIVLSILTVVSKWSGTRYFTRPRSCIVPAEMTEPLNISGGQNHKYDGR